MPPKKADPKVVAPSPSWTLDKGISYSLLSRFINCRERFRLHTVEGMREERSSKEAMNWGTYFHELIEIHSTNPNLSPQGIIRRAARSIPNEERQIANIVFEEYLLHYAECNYRYFAQEQEFKVPYFLPNGKKVFLVGKTDEVILNDDNTLTIQENKTKEKINEYKIESSLTNDLQTMMYAVCVEALFKKPVTGVIYNVIRNPSIRPKAVPAKKSGTGKARKETIPEFQNRLREEIKKNPSHYYKRWNIPLSKERSDQWKKTTFNPLLMQLISWWESVKHDPFSPWVLPSGEPNPHHWMRPFGVYDPMTTGTGDYFDYLTRGLSVGVSVGNPPFPELITIQ